uniref:Secreted protein n=1 Tax=Tetraselmis sp. GSL018 TaxID=582737 RepID=A0A061RQJ5_9CHLO
MSSQNSGGNLMQQPSVCLLLLLPLRQVLVRRSVPILAAVPQPAAVQAPLLAVSSPVLFPPAENTGLAAGDCAPALLARKSTSTSIEHGFVRPVLTLFHGGPGNQPCIDTLPVETPRMASAWHRLSEGRPTALQLPTCCAADPSHAHTTPSNYHSSSVAAGACGHVCSVMRHSETPR